MNTNERNSRLADYYDNIDLSAEIEQARWEEAEPVSVRRLFLGLVCA